jgi:hypothetical protein
MTNFLIWKCAFYLYLFNLKSIFLAGYNLNFFLVCSRNYSLTSTHVMVSYTLFLCLILHLQNLILLFNPRFF